jgi:hypothetical protein
MFMTKIGCSHSSVGYRAKGAMSSSCSALANETRWGYEIGFPGGGHWREVFNSDVYERWVNPSTQGNGGGIEANGSPDTGWLTQLR